MENQIQVPVNAAGDPAHRHMPRVLLVDDDAVIRHLMASTLRANEIPFALAKNGREALEISRDAVPDVIILDINLPDMTGFDVLSAWKENVSTKHVPVIMLSSSDNQDDVAKGISLGAQDYVVKPPRESDLLARILALNMQRRLRQIAEGSLAAGDSVGFSVEELNKFLRRNASAILPKGIRSPRLILGYGTVSLFAYVDFSALRRSDFSSHKPLLLAKDVMKERPIWIEAKLHTEAGVGSVRFTAVEIGGRELSDPELEFFVREYVLHHLPVTVGQNFGLGQGIERLEIRHGLVTVVISEPSGVPLPVETAQQQPAEDLPDRLAIPNRRYWS